MLASRPEEPTMPARLPRPRAARVLFVLALLAPAPPAAAVALHKCVDARGQASYQSQPCAPGQSQAWVREVVPEAAPARPASPPPASPARPRPAPAAGRRAGPRPGGAGDAQAACRAARAADAAYRRRPLSQIRHAELRRLGDEIYRHCR
jgi:hypothetical protein